MKIIQVIYQGITKFVLTSKLIKYQTQDVSIFKSIFENKS